MNQRMEKELPIRTRIFFTASIFEGIILVIISIKLVGVSAIFLGLLYIITSIIFFKFLYLHSATKLAEEDNKLEIKLLFQETIVVPLVNISEIEKTGRWAREMRYYVVKYDNKQFNTYFMSYGLKKEFHDFMEELQRRVDNAKKEEEN